MTNLTEVDPRAFLESVAGTPMGDFLDAERAHLAVAWGRLLEIAGPESHALMVTAYELGQQASALPNFAHGYVMGREYTTESGPEPLPAGRRRFELIPGGAA